MDLVICNCLFTFTFVGLPSSVGLQFIIIIISYNLLNKMMAHLSSIREVAETCCLWNALKMQLSVLEC